MYFRNSVILKITNSEITDAGRYICHAENRAGIAERMFDLEVNGTQSDFVSFVSPLPVIHPSVCKNWILRWFNMSSRSFRETVLLENGSVRIMYFTTFNFLPEVKVQVAVTKKIGSYNNSKSTQFLFAKLGIKEWVKKLLVK